MGKYVLSLRFEEEPKYHIIEELLMKLAQMDALEYLGKATSYSEDCMPCEEEEVDADEEACITSKVFYSKPSIINK